MYHKSHSLEVYNLKIFSKFCRMNNHQNIQILECFSSPPKDSLFLYAGFMLKDEY
jgi:hypothetical protein